MALLITLTIISLLITGTLELNRRVRAAVVSTAVMRDRISLSQMANTGLHAAMAMLIKDKMESDIDSIQEDWADPEKVAEVLADFPYEKGKLTFGIQDESGKIQINALVDFPKGRHFNESQKIMWDRFIRLLLSQNEASADEVEASGIVNSIKDWLDSGDDDATTGLNGAEADYYQGLDPPYAPGNGPFTHIDELMLVKDITPELFRGAEAQLPGAENFLTVHGMTPAPRPVDRKNFTFEGKININTADLPVLMAMMPSENPEYARAIHDYRNEKADGKFVNDLTSPTWYKNVPEIPGDFSIDPKLIATSSDFFRIESTAELQETTMTLTVVVHREQGKNGKWTCKVLSWQAS